MPGSSLNCWNCLSAVPCDPAPNISAMHLKNPRRAEHNRCANHRSRKSRLLGLVGDPRRPCSERESYTLMLTVYGLGLSASLGLGCNAV